MGWSSPLPGSSLLPAGAGAAAAPLGHAGRAWSAAVPSWDREGREWSWLGLPCLSSRCLNPSIPTDFGGLRAVRESLAAPEGMSREVCPAECRSSCSSLGHHPHPSRATALGWGQPHFHHSSVRQTPQEKPNPPVGVILLLQFRLESSTASARGIDRSLPCSSGWAPGCHLGTGRAGGVVAAPGGQGPV